MPVYLIDSHDDAAFAAWFDVLRVTDEERWPDSPGWDHRTVKAMADLRDGAMDFLCLAATDESGATVGIGVLQVPNWENRHQATLDVRALPSQRRRSVGAGIVAEAERWAFDVGRKVLFAEAEVPVTALDAHASAPFARHLGFEAVHLEHRRHLALPPDPARIERLAAEVADATAGYRVRTFVTPWPEDHMEDYCELLQRMSTDAPSSDAHAEEEVWNAARVKENDDLLVTQGITKLAAVADHLATGRLIAFSEIAVPEARPEEAWQWATLVLREHRGHRLGLAVKLANLGALCAAFPMVRRVITGNAQQNAPMIAINEAMGFEVAANQTVWRKDVGPS